MNIGASRLSTLLKSLEVDGIVAKVGSGWVRTEKPYNYDADRVRSTIAARRAEQAAMGELRRRRPVPDAGPALRAR